MVKTDAEELDNLPASERVKRLRALRQRKREELEKGEEELRRLRSRKLEELRETEGRLEESLEELEREEERSREGPARSLEEEVESSPEVAPAPAGQGQDLERLMPVNLYELSDYNLYGELRRIERKGYLTPDEQRRISALQAQASAITESYARSDVSELDRQRGNYLSRTEEVLKRLDRRMRDVSTPYDLNRRPDHDAVYQ